MDRAGQVPNAASAPPLPPVCEAHLWIFMAAQPPGSAVEAPRAQAHSVQAQVHVGFPQALSTRTRAVASTR